MTKIVQRGETTAARNHSIAAAGGSARFVAVLAAALALSIVGSGSAIADMAIVQQDATPIASNPGVGGHILTHVDAGFRLIVLGSDGEWLRVASPELPLTGSLWVPAARVGDLVPTPADLVLPNTAPRAEVPQFRMVTTTGGVTITSLGTAGSVGQRESKSVSAVFTRSKSSAGGDPAQKTGSGTSSATAAARPSDNPAPTEGNPTPAVSGNPTPAVSGNPTPAVSGNPTPAVSGNPTPAVSGNPTPAMGNPTPAMGNTVVTVGN
jgi:hypothetical protein